MNVGAENFIPEKFYRFKGKNYHTKSFLGRGAFAECWEIREKESNAIYALKIIPKVHAHKKNYLAKIKREIQIHKSLNHYNIVKFIFTFSDKSYIYMALENCTRNSLFELQKRRVRITEPEVRYFSRQIIAGCKYLHTLSIIHRDIKLSNLLLNQNLDVKIADFGIATYDSNAKQKKRICGTPNYIAPEILRMTGHSFEVDVWSIGCVIYTLLVGQSPFQKSTMRETCEYILANKYVLPKFLTKNAQDLIRKMLSDNPLDRPKLSIVIYDIFFENFTPESLPISCLTTSPRFDGYQQATPLNDYETSECKGLIISIDKLTFIHNCLKSLNESLKKLLSTNLEKSLDVGNTAMCKSIKPELAPIFWIARWVDNSDYYGLSYELSDSSSGLLFNDFTRLIITKNKRNLQYIDRNGKEQLFTTENIPEWLNRKYSLLVNYFDYMTKNLQKTGENNEIHDSDHMTRLPYLAYWKRSKSAILFLLSNGSAQINFFESHEKLILCPIMESITVITKEQLFTTYKIELLERHGITSHLAGQIQTSLNIISDIRDMIISDKEADTVVSL